MTTSSIIKLYEECYNIVLNQLSSKHNGHRALKNTKNIEINPITLSFNIHLQTNKTYKCQLKEKTKEDEL